MRAPSPDHERGPDHCQVPGRVPGQVPGARRSALDRGNRASPRGFLHPPNGFICQSNIGCHREKVELPPQTRDAWRKHNAKVTESARSASCLLRTTEKLANSAPINLVVSYPQFEFGFPCLTKPRKRGSRSEPRCRGSRGWAPNGTCGLTQVFPAARTPDWLLARPGAYPLPAAWMARSHTAAHTGALRFTHSSRQFS